MTRQQAISRWKDIASAVFWAEENLSKEWNNRLKEAPSLDKDVIIMAQYIEKAALVAEIERRIKEGEAVVENVPSSAILGLIQAYKNILSFIDTLEVKEVQEEPVSNDLEEAAYQFGNCFESHFGLASMSFIKGAKWQKEQMMKDAVYGLVCGHDESSPAWIDLNLLNKPNIKVGTEVKLIIIKDE